MINVFVNFLLPLKLNKKKLTDEVILYSHCYKIAIIAGLQTVSQRERL